MNKLPVFCIMLFLLLGHQVHAQVSSGGIVPKQEITLEPKFPKPGETVTASVVSYVEGLYGSSKVWTYDGVEVPNSVNQNKISFVAGPIDQPKIISVSFVKTDGSRTSLQTKVIPRYIDIIIEPQTHVPEFYLGRPLPSVGSFINATAIISGLGSPANYIYTWRIGRVVVGDGALRGKNSISFIAPLDKNIIVSLQVEDLEGKVVADKTISVTSVYPMVKFYESNTLLGLQQATIGQNFTLVGNSSVIKAEPYYLDSRVYNSPAILEWKINNILYKNSTANPYEVTLQKDTESDSRNRSQLNFHVRDTTELLQGAKGGVDINL